MPYALTFIGLILVVTGLRNTYAQLGTQLKSDFTGPNNFTYFIVALGIVGAAGYVKALEGLSRLFMTLIIVSIFLAKGNKSFFSQFADAINKGPATITPAADTSGTTSPAASAAATAVGNAIAPPAGTLTNPTLKESLMKPGGGGAWDYFGSPSPF